MKKLLLLLVSTILSFNAYADFESGLTAAKNGEFEQALLIWEPVAEEGNIDAQFNLGLMYDHGMGVLQSYEQAIYWYTKAAKQGGIGAQHNLGVIYDLGEGALQDYEKAAYWYTQAAEQGNLDSQYNLGHMFAYGQGVSKDYEKALYWYTKAAEQEDGYAQYNIGVMHLNGEGANQSYINAAFWIKLSIDNGVEEAKALWDEFELWKYVDTSADLDKAIEYAEAGEIEKAEIELYNISQLAMEGNPKAMCEFGTMYMKEGYWIVQSDESAVEWWLKSANSGYAPCQFSVGSAYLIGKGIEKDLSQAKHWLQKAIDSDDEEFSESAKVLYGIHELGGY